MNAHFLYVDAQNLKASIANLVAAYPELADDEALLLDTLEGETDFVKLVGRLLDARAEAEGMSIALRARINDLSARKARFERQSDGYKRLVHSLMEAAGVDKLTLPEASLSIRQGSESVNVIDVNELPQGYFKTERQADKAAIKSAIKAGEQIPGAELVTGDASLTIRTK